MKKYHKILDQKNTKLSPNKMVNLTTNHKYLAANRMSSKTQRICHVVNQMYILLEVQSVKNTIKRQYIHTRMAILIKYS